MMSIFRRLHVANPRPLSDSFLRFIGRCLKKNPAALWLPPLYGRLIVRWRHCCGTTGGWCHRCGKGPELTTIWRTSYAFFAWCFVDKGTFIQLFHISKWNKHIDENCWLLEHFCKLVKCNMLHCYSFKSRRYFSWARNKAGGSDIDEKVDTQGRRLCCPITRRYMEPLTGSV